MTTVLSPTNDASPLGSPYARANLRHNPFGEPAEEDLPELIVADIDSMMSWLSGGHHALQLIGHCGRGKSARLHALRARWRPLARYVYLAEGEPIPQLPNSGTLLLDECQRLPKKQRRRLFRQLDSIALATHEDHEHELRAAGWQVRTIEISGLELAQFSRIIDRRLGWARLSEGPVPTLRRRTIARLHSQYGDDLRGALAELYELYQDALTGSSDPAKLHQIFEPNSHLRRK